MEKHFKGNPALLQLQEDVQGFHKQVIRVFNQPQTSPGSLLKQARAKDFSKFFIVSTPAGFILNEVQELLIWKLKLLILSQ